MARNDDSDLTSRWSGRLTLTQRILAINIFALALFAGSLFYLDSYRNRALEARMDRLVGAAKMASASLSDVAPERRPALARQLGALSGTRLRVYDASGRLAIDSWRGATPNYTFRDPEQEPWNKNVARGLDRLIDAIVGAPRLPDYRPGAGEQLSAWPEAQMALSQRKVTSTQRLTPEATPFLTVAVPSAGEVLLLSANARDVRAQVRDERLTLGFILLGAILLSVFLSLFLARTIALPLRRLARAAHRVRLGRARDVAVPRLPERRDEIGLLARALGDMTQTLRDRIDATEAFAADVTHELKNPLASLRSAVDSLARVDDPALRAQLTDVLRDDVNRLDRLVVDIAETSRLDAELSRARFRDIDVGHMIETLLAVWEPRAAEKKVSLAFARPRVGTAMIQGDESRLARALDNLVDNAVSFSGSGSLVEITATRAGPDVLIAVEDEGAGVPEHLREAIFERFHSIRPEDEEFGRHSGLGLAIAKAIVEGHGGRIEVAGRHDGRAGARFVIRMKGIDPQ